tara:strand:- start:215 stop:493 length:279 start_codon:yes stop_codon:yes gene_type:complete
MEMSEAKKVLQLGRLPKKELHELTKTDNTVLATALIYSISELIVSSYLDQNVEPDIREIVKEAAQFAVELTKGVNIVYDDLHIDLTENQVIH